MDVRGRGVLVTGASRGLGAALARALARAGAHVVLTARHIDEVTAVAEEIRAAGGIAHALEQDVGDKQDVYRIAGTAAELVGPLELLVHNASSLGPVPLRRLAEVDCEDLERVLSVNLVGPFRLTKAVVGSMVLRGRGTVLHISSDAALGAYPSWGPYGASKAALDLLSRTWAAELEGTGVRVLSVDPGEMDTRMHADAVPGADRAALADPQHVARGILALLQDPDVTSGARLEARRWVEVRS